MTFQLAGPVPQLCQQQFYLKDRVNQGISCRDSSSSSLYFVAWTLPGIMRYDPSRDKLVDYVNESSFGDLVVHHPFNISVIIAAFVGDERYGIIGRLTRG